MTAPDLAEPMQKQNEITHEAKSMTQIPPSFEQDDWLEKLLGPPPGRPTATRTRAEREEQRARLEQLAQPRARTEPTPPEVTNPTRQRSPRSQREACNRL